MGYANKDELKDEIWKSYFKYISEFDDINDESKDLQLENCDRTPAENLACVLGRTTQLISWERGERVGNENALPTDYISWNHLNEFYSWVDEAYGGMSLAEMRGLLSMNIKIIFAIIDTTSDEDMFKPHRRKWTDLLSKEGGHCMAKLIHLNTVAPFKSFRTKIRRWKKTYRESV